MKVIAALTDPSAIRKYLDHGGVPPILIRAPKRGRNAGQTSCRPRIKGNVHIRA